MTDMPCAGFLCAGKTPFALSVSIHCAYKMMDMMKKAGFSVGACHTVVTEPFCSGKLETARKTLEHICCLCDVVITVGCDGFAVSDIMPDVSEELCEKNVPYFSAVLCGSAKTDDVMLAPSRAYAGIFGRTLVLNFPGNVKAGTALISSLMPAVGFAVYSLSGKSARNCAEFKKFLDSSLDFHEVFKKECIVNI